MFNIVYESLHIYIIFGEEFDDCIIKCHMSIWNFIIIAKHDNRLGWVPIVHWERWVPKTYWGWLGIQSIQMKAGHPRYTGEGHIPKVYLRRSILEVHRGRSGIKGIQTKIGYLKYIEKGHIPKIYWIRMGTWGK